MPTQLLLPVYAVGAWSANVDDDFGCRWVVSPGQNVNDGPGVKTHITDKPFGVGSFRAKSYRAGRSIIMTGWCKAPDRVTREAARARFLSLFPAGDQATLSVADGISTRLITVELADIPKATVWPSGNGFDWQLPLYAADPRYLDALVNPASASAGGASTDGLDWTGAGAGGLDWTGGGTGGLDWGTSASGGVLTMTNAGSATAYPLFTITGPINAPIISDPGNGRTLAYSGLVDVGQTLVIDTSPFTRKVQLNGIDRMGLMTSAQWISIPAGGTVTVSFAGSGSGILTAQWQNAYQ